MSSKDMRPSVEIPLDFPITVDGREVSSLNMRRPKAGDELRFAEAKGSPARRALALLADLTEIAPKDLEELDAADFAKLEAQYAAFKGAPSGTSDAQS